MFIDNLIGGMFMEVMDMDTLDIKKKLLELNEDDLNKPWCEGYLSALVDTNVINEDEFDTLMQWLNDIYN